jgi:hypothetical protein
VTPLSTATLPVPNLISRSPLRRGVLLIPFAIALAGFALSPTARAVSPAPDGGYPGGNTAEGQNALQSLTTGIDNTAVGSNALFHNTTGGYNTANGLIVGLSTWTGRGASGSRRPVPDSGSILTATIPPTSRQSVKIKLRATLMCCDRETAILVEANKGLSQQFLTQCSHDFISVGLFAAGVYAKRSTCWLTWAALPILSC